MIVLPLLTTRSVVGVLKVFSDAPDFFSSDQENALAVLASYFTRSLYQAEVAKTRAEQFEVFANCLPQLIWIAKANGNIHWYNDRWYEYTATKAQDMEGWGWQHVNSPRVLPSVARQSDPRW